MKGDWGSLTALPVMQGVGMVMGGHFLVWVARLVAQGVGCLRVSPLSRPFLAKGFLGLDGQTLCGGAPAPNLAGEVVPERVSCGPRDNPCFERL